MSEAIEVLKIYRSPESPAIVGCTTVGLIVGGRIVANPSLVSNFEPIKISTI